MADLPPVSVEFKGDTSNLSAAITTAQRGLQNFAQTANTTNNAQNGLRLSTIAFGTALGQMLTNVIGRVADFGKSFVTEYQKIGQETRSVMKVLGGTAEEASRLRYAAHALGIETGTLSAGMRQLSLHIANNDKVARGLGIAFRDARGNMIPTIEILKQIADKIVAIPPGLERTAVATKIFGRSMGIELLPLLSLGSKGIVELAAEADKLGLTLTQKNLDAIKKYSMATKEQQSAVAGLKVAIGEQLLPVLTRATEKLTAFTTGILKNLKGFIENGGQIVTTLVGVLAASSAALPIMANLAQIMSILSIRGIGAAIAMTAIAVATVYLTNKFDGFGTVVYNVFSGLVSIATTFYKVIIGVFAGIKIGVSETVKVFYQAKSSWEKLFGSESQSQIYSNLAKQQDMAIQQTKKWANTTSKLFDQAGNDLRNKFKKGVSGIENADFTAMFNQLGKVAKDAAKSVTGDGGALDINALLDSITGKDKKGKKIDMKKIAADAANTILQNTKDYWSKVVDSAKSARDIAREAYDKTVSLMKDAYSKVATGIDISKFIDAPSQTAKDMVAAFKKKLDSAKQFVSDLRSLKTAGLDPMLLAQLANAGPESAGLAASSLVADTGSIAELNALQKELIGLSTGAAELYQAPTTFEDIALATSVGQAYVGAEATYSKALSDQQRSEALAQQLVDQSNNSTNTFYVDANSMSVQDVQAMLAQVIALGVQPQTQPPATSTTNNASKKRPRKAPPPAPKPIRVAPHSALVAGNR